MSDKLNPYINEEGQGELRDSVVAFIDILGFRARVRDEESKGNSQRFFSEFQEMILAAFSTLDSSFAKDCYEISGGLFDIKNNYKFRIFTDCILIGSPIRKTRRPGVSIEGLDEFDTVLRMLHFLQSQLVNHGFFIRGAIAVGEFYIDDVTIYGLAGIDAYEAESEQAKYPRIILTKAAEDMFMEINDGFQNQRYPNYVTRYMFKDNDGLFFINYLESINIADEPFLDVLEEHKKVIEDRLQKYHDKPDILEKYVWAANYHNRFCNHDNKNEYRIDITQYQMQSIVGTLLAKCKRRLLSVLKFSFI